VMPISLVLPSASAIVSRPFETIGRVYCEI
jgi:hypothetical protein